MIKSIRLLNFRNYKDIQIKFSKNDNEALTEVYILDFFESKYRVLKKVKIDD